MYTVKQCRRCGVTQSLNEFYEHPMMLDKHLNICKSCKKADSKKYRVTVPTEIMAGWKSKYRHSDTYRVLISTEAYKEARKVAGRLYIKKYPEKFKAQGVVRYAMRKGVLLPQPCEICEDVLVNAHHDDYSNPLQVRWLCRFHHIEFHKQRGDYRKEEF